MDNDAHEFDTPEPEAIGWVDEAFRRLVEEVEHAKMYWEAAKNYDAKGENDIAADALYNLVKHFEVIAEGNQVMRELVVHRFLPPEMLMRIVAENMTAATGQIVDIEPMWITLPDGTTAQVGRMTMTDPSSLVPDDASELENDE